MRRIIITVYAFLFAATAWAWTPQYQIKRTDRPQDVNAINSNFNDLSISAVDKQSSQVISGSKYFSGQTTFVGNVSCERGVEFNGSVSFSDSIEASSATFIGDVSVSGNATFNGGSTFTGSVTGVLPTGTILTFISTTAPQGFLYCDGASYSTASYPELFAVIGYTFGGSGSTFRVPDFRGRFLRGMDNGAGRDPDKSGRTAMNTGGLTGDNIGSLETDAFQGHWHKVYGGVGTTGSGAWVNPSGTNATDSGPTGFSWAMYAALLLPDSTHGTPRASSETRPINANVAYIIKY
jgi:microcystin-dependent protein